MFTWYHFQEVGMPADYVNKLARMFQDIKVSDDLNQEFKDAHRNNNEGIAGEIQNFENSPNISMHVPVYHTWSVFN